MKNKTMKKLTSLFVIINLCVLSLAPVAAYGQLRGAVAPAAPAATAAKLRKSAGAIPNQYIVVFNNSVAASNVEALAEALTRAHGGTIGFTYQSALRGFSVQLNEAQAVALSRNPQVEYVEQDVLIEGASTQTTNSENGEWGLDRIDQRDLALNNSYTYASNGAGVNAYVIDSGIRLSHQEFEGRAVYAYDNVGDGRNGVDCNGHGTHVAGIIGGKTYGVAKGVKLHAVRVLTCTNTGSAARIIGGIDWVTANHVKPAVVNLSFASSLPNDALDLAVRNSITAGLPFIVSAGNNNINAGTRSPSRVAEAITVAATDRNDYRASFSNFGTVVDVFAPGVDIMSAWSTDDTFTNLRSGTSTAAPFVAGLVARYLAGRPGDQPDAVWQALMNDSTSGKVINPGDGSPNLLAYTAITISDDFNDNTRDAAKWNVGAASGGNVVEQNGRLEVTPPADTTGYNGYYSATNCDLTNSRTSVEVIPGNAGAYGAETYFTLAEGNNYVLFATGGGNLLFQTAVAGAMTRTYIPYNATQHRFWRFRHNRTLDTVNWETSPDGVTWTTQRTVTRQFSITNLQTQLQSGKYTATTYGGTAIYDNLWHEANPTVPVAVADNFDDNLINSAMWTTTEPASPTTIAEQNGRIEVTLQPNTAGYNSLSTQGLDFRDKTLQVELVQPTSQGGWVETFFQLSLDSNNYFLFDTGAGSFVCDAWINGVRDRSGFNWDGSRFWRFRHDADAGTVSFDTSMDGVTWATRKTIAIAFPLSSMKSALGAGAWGTGNGAPGMAVFDNFRLERFRPSFPLSDNFNDNTRDAKWNTLATPGSVIVEQNGRLEITPAAAMPGYDGYVSANTIDLTDARSTVEAVSVPAINGFATFYALRAPNGNYLMLGQSSSGTLITQRSVGGVVTQTSVPYNAVQQRYWRFRHNRANNTVNYETSPDGAAWTTQATYPTPFDITNLQVLLVGQKSTATSPNDTVVFDNLRIERNEGGKAR